MEKRELGTVISTQDGPTTISFCFVISDRSVRKGQFVKVGLESGGFALGSITEITRANRYFERAESVAEYERNIQMAESFPTSEWEYVVANVRVYGIFADEGSPIARSTFPVAPGAKVLEAEPGLLEKFLFFDRKGLHIGQLQHHPIEARLSMGKLFGKHLAILAMSGSGKSYLTSVMIEELLERKSEDGRLAMVVIDSHGEYSGFRSTRYGRQVEVVSGKRFKIAFRRVSPHQLAEWMPEASAPQMRELVPIMQLLRKEKKEKQEGYLLSDLMQRVEACGEEKKSSVFRPLLSWLSELARLKLFSTSDFPKLEEAVQPGRLVVIDLSDTENMRKKQIIVSYLARRLFRLRKKGKIPPFVLFLEEAHNFAPEKAEKSSALAKGAITAIAREGRKFGSCLCLISQRPVHLATTVLAQCNTNIILRITNPYDIEHIGESCEGIDRNMLDSITTLRVGEAMVIGEAVGAPVFIQVRKRKSELVCKGKDLQEEAVRFEEEKKKKKQDVEAFL
ncbi:MAG: ATP-binding protein [Candidatus Micrarchaeota archaeon]|nr:ATP-binding protein [Candidatus Micrarchaeota archaeon]